MVASLFWFCLLFTLVLACEGGTIRCFECTGTTVESCENAEDMTARTCSEAYDRCVKYNGMHSKERNQNVERELIDFIFRRTW